MSTGDAADRDVNEIFVYSYRTVPAKSPFWAALSTAGCPVRIFMDNPSPEHLAQWAVAGHIVEPRPLSFERIARQAKMVVCHGGHGFISSSMMAGLPTCAVYSDLEKRLNGEAVVRTGTGAAVNLFGVTANEIANAIHAVYNYDIYSQRARTISNEIDRRQYPSLLSALESAWYSL
ncbi:hypothetical protein NPJ82_10175 [Sphingomonas sp. NY01]|uniref:glycosyltransferase n=1 Tax=Sphingomonas sp. NY01 TaxID=2968057 RepID=UPI00315CD1DC